MQTNILVKRVLGIDSVKQDPTTEGMVHTLQDTVLKRVDENTLTAARAENKSKMQPSDEFRYSGRCYVGVY